MIRLLLDTHTLLWAWVSPHKLSNKVHTLLADPANTRLVSSVTAYEIALKFRLGKLAVQPDLVSNYLDHLRHFQAQELPVLSAHALAAASYGAEHRDPFDRILAAQSQLESVPLVTADAAFALFPVRALW